jgi:hypothetical protein
MLTKSTPNTGQQNLFHSELFSQLDTKDPLIQLANAINLAFFIRKMTKKDRVFYQNLVDLSVIYCGFIVINQFVVWFLRVD